jgi:multidrug resistance efflux pump
LLTRAAHGRIATLHEQRSATSQELDEATAALDMAEARLAGAQARVREATSALDAADRPDAPPTSRRRTAR